MHHYGAGTNVGNVRDNNEDSYVCDGEKELWIVADGMGGLGFGEVASAITTFTVAKLVREGQGVNQAIEIAHRNIKQYADSDGFGTNMGTTIVLLLSHGSLYNIFWVGDSRAYLFDGQDMKQITVDHSLVQSLIDQGELTKEEAITDPRKNAVTRALGVKEIDTVRADSVSERWQPNQKILLCSDGLTDCVRDEDIESIMRGEGSDQEIVDELIEAALEGGGNDNITVIVVSAPTAAKSGDSDTHVPAEEGDSYRGDDTFIPSLNDDTQSRDDNHQSSIDVNQQLTLALNHESIAVREESSDVDRVVKVIDFPTNEHSKQDSGQNDHDETVKRSPWQQLGTIAAVVICLALVFSFQLEETDAAPISQHFHAVETIPATPVSRNLPELNFERAGHILQVGLFNQLEGAEKRQRELAQIGLLPHIEKRSSGSTTKYAVILGPLPDAAHQQVVANLERHDFRFFHRVEAG